VLQLRPLDFVIHDGQLFQIQRVDVIHSASNGAGQPQSFTRFTVFAVGVLTSTDAPPIARELNSNSSVLTLPVANTSFLQTAVFRDRDARLAVIALTMLDSTVVVHLLAPPDFDASAHTVAQLFALPPLGARAVVRDAFKIISINTTVEYVKNHLCSFHRRTTHCFRVEQH
jgi:hypothetical protein